MLFLRLSRFVPLLLLGSASVATPMTVPVDPLRFFVGRTESVGRVKIMFQKDFATRSVGLGRIEPDGSLLLVQQVFDEGKAPQERRWHIRQVAPGRYTGTMTEASGPVVIDKVGDRYRFRFAMHGRLAVEQLMAPMPGGRVASSTAKIRKLGLVVATTSGIIRRVA